MKPPRHRCRCAKPYDLCAPCRAWATRQKPGSHHTYQGIARRTWATAQDVQEITRLRGLRYPWVQIVALVGVTMGALGPCGGWGWSPSRTPSMPDNAPTWRLLLLAAGCALASAAVLGLAIYAGCLWTGLP